MTVKRKSIALIPKSKKVKTILLLEDIKSSIKTLHKGNSIAFASDTLEVMKKAVGEQSNQYFSINNLLTDDTGARMQKQIIPTDSLIVGKVKNNEQNFISLLDSCIKQVNAFGLYSPPSERKNFLGDFDNGTLITLILLFAGLFFGLGYGYCKYNIERFEKGGSIVIENHDPRIIQKQKKTEQQSFDTIQKIHTK